MLVAQKDAITRITGIITPESIDGLENELGGAFTKLKSTHFAEGQRYGFLATVIPQEKYRIVISDAAWAYAAPGNPGAYAAAALAPGVSAAQREQLVAQHKEEQTAYAGEDVANAIFDLPNSRQSLKYFHAAGGFPTKESFTDAV